MNGRGVTKEFKQTHKSPKLTVYDPSTASYIRADKKVGDPVPAGGTIGWAFWDPRLSGWRVKKDDLIESNTGPLFFGKDKSAFNLRTFSITVSMLKGDVPSSYIAFAREWAEKVSVKFGVGVERGSKEKNLHLQMMVITRAALDDGTAKEMNASLKAALSVSRGDGVHVQVKGHNHPKFLLGYIQKVRHATLPFRTKVNLMLSCIFSLCAGCGTSAPQVLFRWLQ